MPEPLNSIFLLLLAFSTLHYAYVLYSGLIRRIAGFAARAVKDAQALRQNG